MTLWFLFPYSICLTFGIFGSLPLKLGMLASLVVGTHSFSLKLFSLPWTNAQLTSGSNAPSLASPLNTQLLLFQAPVFIFAVKTGRNSCIFVWFYVMLTCDWMQTSVVMSTSVPTCPGRYFPFQKCTSQARGLLHSTFYAFKITLKVI